MRRKNMIKRYTRPSVQRPTEAEVKPTAATPSDMMPPALQQVTEEELIRDRATATVDSGEASASLQQNPMQEDVLTSEPVCIGGFTIQAEGDKLTIAPREQDAPCVKKHKMVVATIATKVTGQDTLLHVFIVPATTEATVEDTSNKEKDANTVTDNEVAEERIEEEVKDVGE
jgi:hypothetical protein